MAYAPKNEIRFIRIPVGENLPTGRQAPNSGDKFRCFVKGRPKKTNIKNKI
jgi:hypothetical protein